MSPPRLKFVPRDKKALGVSRGRWSRFATGIIPGRAAPANWKIGPALLAGYLLVRADERGWVVPFLFPELRPGAHDQVPGVVEADREARQRLARRGFDDVPCGVEGMFWTS